MSIIYTGTLQASIVFEPSIAYIKNTVRIGILWKIYDILNSVYVRTKKSISEANEDHVTVDLIWKRKIAFFSLLANWR